MLCRLILWSVSPSRMSTPQGQKAQFGYQWIFKLGENWHPECPLPDKSGMKGPSQSWLSLLFKVLQLMAYQTLWWDSNSWLENSFLKPIFPSKVPSPHLLEPWDRKERKGWDGKETERKRVKGRRKRRTGKKKKKTFKAKCRYCSGFPVFSIYSLIHMEEESGSTIHN